MCVYNFQRRRLLLSWSPTLPPMCSLETCWRRPCCCVSTQFSKFVAPLKAACSGCGGWSIQTPLAWAMSSSMLPSWQPCNEVAVSHKLSTVAQAPGNGSGSASSSANVVEQVPRPVARPLSSQPWSPSGLVFHSGDEDVLEPAESPVLGAGSRRRRLSVKRSAEVLPEARKSKF